jgi:hypothetical protein
MGLYERDNVTAVCPLHTCWKRKFLWRPSEINNDEVYLLWGFNMKRIGSFERCDTFIASKFPSECSVACVNCENFRCTTLQKAIGKAADVATKISARHSSDIKIEFL